MSDMPQRPREHALADESEHAFKSLLPSRWIYRAKPPDYGIDGEVELVTPEGQLTGRLFYVQLKGTDTVDRSDALTVRLKTSTANYYRSLDLPVLIVRYLASSRQLYAKWFDASDESLAKSDQDSVSLKLSSADEITGERAQKIPAELEGITSLKFNRFSLPIRLAINFPNGRVRGLTGAELVSELRSITTPDIVRFEPDAPMRVDIENENIEIAASIVRKTSYPTDRLRGRGSVRSFAANLLAAIGITLTLWKQTRAGAALILSSLSDGDLLRSFDYGLLAAFCLAADGRANDALRVADESMGDDQSLDLAQAMTAVPILSPYPTAANEIQIDLMRKIAARADRQPRSILKASTKYNLANRLRWAGLRREALRQYHLAVSADRSYFERSYVWRELGGLLFESGHFRWAADCYRRAVANSDKECQLCLADSLMFAGEYETAKAEFDLSLEGMKDPPSEWVLKREFLRNILETFGIKSQRRQRMHALRLADAGTESFSREEFAAAIRVDALCGLAWFNRAVEESRADNQECAAEYFTWAALCQPNDLQAWCSALGSAINGRQTNLFGHATIAAYQRCGEKFFNAVLDFIRNQPDGFPKDEVIDSFAEIISAIPVKRPSRTIRIVSDEGYSELSTPPNY